MEYLDVENDILGERIVDLEVNLCGFVQLGGLFNLVNRVALVHIGDEFEDHGGSLDVSLLLISEYDLALHGIRNPALELNREVDCLTGLNPD
jgi:hypothetical protein